MEVVGGLAMDGQVDAARLVLGDEAEADEALHGIPQGRGNDEGVDEDIAAPIIPACPVG